MRIHPTPQGELGQDTLSIASNISTVAPASLGQDYQGSSSQDEEDMEMDAEAVHDKRSAKGGTILRLKGTYVEVIDRYRNLAPILDAVVADTDDSGQVSVVGNALFNKTLICWAAANYHMFR